jgi:integrase
MVEGCLRSHVIPNFGEKKLQELKPKEVEDFFLALKKQHHLQNNYRYTLWDENELPYLSQNTIRHIYVYFNMALNKAVEWKLLSSNPIIMEAPKIETNHRPAWDEETLLSAMDEIKDPLLHLCLHLAFVGSMRSGEISGLTWGCIDWSEESIGIDKIIQRVKKKDLEESSCDPPLIVFPNVISTREPENVKSCLIMKDPKTENSKRVIYMTEQLKHELLKRRQLVNKRKVVLDGEYHDYDLIICLENGQPVEPKLIAKWFKKFIDKRGGAFPTVTLHSLRSTSTTYKLVLSKGDIKSVQGDTGHANAKMVTDTYAKIQDKSRKKMAKALERNFYRDNKQEETPRPVSEVEAANNLILLQKLSEDPKALQMVLAMLQPSL